MTARKFFQATSATVRPCYRHTAWLAHCDDCTVWHLSAARRISHHV